MRLIDADMLFNIPITKGLAGKKHINDSYLKGVDIVMRCIDALPDCSKHIQVQDILELCNFCNCIVVDAQGIPMDNFWKPEEYYYLTVQTITASKDGTIIIWTYAHIKEFGDDINEICNSERYGREDTNA